uniref:Putative membrane protein C2G11.09 n=2 Tax=Lygus hesperus TaxID=30085 RepID=A0A0A9VZC4_LYGHE
MLRALSYNALNLLQFVEMVLAVIYVSLSYTPQDYILSWAPAPFPYGTKLPESLMISTIGICFGVLQPIVLPFVLLYFITTYFLTKYMLLYVYVTPFETGGQFLPSILHRLLIGLVISQVTILGVLTMKKAILLSFFVAMLPFLTALFYFYCRHKYYAKYTRVSIEGAVKTERERSNLKYQQICALFFGRTIPQAAEMILEFFLPYPLSSIFTEDPNTGYPCMKNNTRSLAVSADTPSVLYTVSLPSRIYNINTLTEQSPQPTPSQTPHDNNRTNTTDVAG